MTCVLKCVLWKVCELNGSAAAAVTQDEIEALYSRFRALDRSSKVACLLIALVAAHLRDSTHSGSGGHWRKSNVMPDDATCCVHSAQGYISAEELLNIPELSINPLTRRLERMFDSVNFKVGTWSLREVALLQ